jgi:hypothetical protein
MPIQAQLHDGRILEFPDGTNPQVIQATVKRVLGVPPSTERTWGEAAGDVGAAAIRGTGQVLQFPGELVGLVPGLRGFGEALATPGEFIAGFGERLKSSGLKAREALRNQALSEAEKEGVLAEFATAIKETIKDPALLSTFLTEQVPQLLGPGAAVKLVRSLGREAVEATAQGAAREAAEKALRERAAAAAVGTGVAMQGADVGNDTYKAVYDLAIKQGMSEEEARALAASKARVAAAEAAAISLATARLPGGSAIERRMAGLPGGSRVGAGLREAGTESLEEAGGAFAKGVGMAEVDPSISPLTGVGTAAGFGALGGLGLGTVVGGAPVKPPGAEPSTGELAPIDVRRQEAARAEAEKAAKAAKAAPPPVPSTQAIIDETLTKPVSQASAQLTLAIERLKEQPASPQRNAAIKELDDELKRREREDAERVQAGKKRAEGFLTAGQAAAQGVTPREEFDPTQARREEIERLRERRESMLVKGKPPARKSPARREFDELDARLVEIGGGRWTPPIEATEPTAPTVEEPTVRSPTPLPDVLDSVTVRTIGFTKGGVHDALVGKAITDPEIRSVLEEYKNRPKANAKTVAKIDAFLARLPEPTPPEAAASVEPTTPYGSTEFPAAPTPPETPSASNVPTEPEPSGAGVPVAGGPAAVSPAQGTGATEPVRVVPPVEDVGQPAAGEGQQPPAVAPPAPAPSGNNTPESDALMDEIRELQKQQQALLTKAGRAPAVNSPARKKWDELGEQIASKKAQWAEMTRAPAPAPAPKAAAPAPTPAAPAPAPKAAAPAPAPAPQVKLTPNQRAELAQRIDQIADRIPQKEYDDFVDNHLNDSGTKVRPEAEHIQAALDLLKKYGPAEKPAEPPKPPKAVKPAEPPKPPKAVKPAEPPKPPAPPARTLPQPKFRQTRFEEASLPNSREMDDALRGASFTEALDYAIENARDDLDRAVMVKVKRRAEELANLGVEFSFELTPRGVTLSGARGVATTSFAGLGESLKVNVQINGYTGSTNNTLRQETLVHEMIHAVTVAQIRYAPQSSAAMKLKALQKELLSKYKQQEKNGQFNPNQKQLLGNALENPYELITYGLVNADVQNWLASTPSPTGGTFLGRFFDLVSQILNLKGKETSALAELMTISESVLDESLQLTVKEANKQYASFGKQPNTTGFPSWVLRHGLKPAWVDGPTGNIALVESVSKYGVPVYLGVNKNENRITFVDVRDYTGTAFTQSELQRLKIAANNLANAAKQAGTTTTPELVEPELELRDTVTPQTEAATAGVNAIGKESKKSLADFLRRNPALAARIKATDYLAGLDDIFTKAYAGKVRDATGNLNPMVLISRALDHGRVSLEAMRTGGLKIKDGLVQAAELTVPEDSKEFPLVAGKTISYQKDVIERLAKEAEKAGTTYEKYRTQVDTVLYGHREYYLREHNREVEKQALALEAAGKTKEADQLREDQTIELLIKDDAKLDALEAEFQRNKDIQEISQTLDAIRFNNLDVLVETNRLSPEKAQEYKDNIGYIPFKRIVEYEAGFDTARGGNRGIAALKNIRNLEGSSRESLSVIENFAGFMDWSTREAMLNNASLSALKDMELLKLAKKGANNEVGATGANVKVYDKGEKVEYYVPDPAHVIAFTFQPPELSSVFKKMQTASNILRAGVTSMPPFAVKQIFDDIARAYAYSGVKNPMQLTARILTSFPANWYREAFGKKQNATVREMAKLGIFGTFDFTKGGNLRDILQEAGAEGRSIGKTIMRFMEAGAKASDVSVRQAIYEQVLKETGDAAAAESRAREIINFSRRGASNFMNTMIAIVPFFNAYARGMDKLAVAGAGKVVGQSAGQARSMFYKRMGVMTVMGVAYAMMMSDDDEYNALPDHVRDTNWILPYGKYLGFTPAIPIPAELAFFFKAIPERVVRYYKLQGTDEEKAAIEVVGNLLKRGVDVFSSPNVTAQLLRPFVENITNYSWFLGRPLESQGQLALDPFQRFGTGTSDTAKEAAKKLEDLYQTTGVELFRVSPIKIENAIRGILGTTAGVALAISDAFVNPTRTDRPLHQMLAAQLTGASAVMKDPVGTRYLDEVYDLEKDVNRVNSTYNRMLEREPENADEYLRKNVGLFSIRPAVSSLMKTIKELNDEAALVDRTTEISRAERRTLINQLRAQQNQIAQQVGLLRTQARKIQQGM